MTIDSFDPKNAKNRLLLEAYRQSGCLSLGEFARKLGVTTGRASQLMRQNALPIKTIRQLVARKMLKFCPACDAELQKK